ncbi:hypothetical protein AVEN_167326-1 [Araneus ventricosus]|uniref:BTB domain-containing protein n=1 Tax=Araneus ventricosus TaxID=182803 RepID=A0A4Y2DFB7_ARAVE|nr:hypothetical protein AVEN_167326-1 [Araneus ventricosus]
MSQKRKFNSDTSNLNEELKYDAVLRTEDGRKFQVHIDLLASQSDFFKALFCDGFGDGRDVLLKGIGAKSLESILEYIYTGSINLNKNNAVDIFVASD